MRRPHLRPFVFLAAALAFGAPASVSFAGDGGKGRQPPAATAAPTVSGTPAAGNTLTGNNGSWDGVSLAFAYQWKRCDSSGNACASIAGATSSSYTLGTGDVGATLRFAVTATNKNGSTAATSSPTPVVAPASTPSPPPPSPPPPPPPPPSPPPPPPPAPPANTALPQVTGTAQVSLVLTGSNGSWSGSPTSYSHQWKRCDPSGGACTDIPFATQSSYTATTSDLGKTLRFAVTARNSAGSGTAVSGPTLAVSAAPPPVVSNPYANRVGFSSHTDYLSPTDGYAYMQRATAAGVHWFREDFWWSVLEPQRGQFSWGPTDALMTNASRLGGDVVAMVGFSPAWASGRSDDKYPPLNPSDYANFAVAVARRYGANGSFWAANPGLARRPLRAIEIWNEPWLWAFWKPNPDPAAYAALVRAAAPAIKAADPNIKVLISGDLHFGWADGRGNTWLEGWLSVLLTKDLPMASVDGWSVHPYCGNLDPYATTIPFFADQRYAQQWLYQKLLLVRDMTAAAGKFKPIWSTEFGWSTAGDVDAATQSRYTTGAIRRAVDEWSSFVERSFIYVLEKPHNGDRDGGYNLLWDDLSAKPAWDAVSALLRT